MLAILALTFLLSWLTWEFVENPCRNFGRRLSEC
jgi:peptidoglycan/LPS O-acetylase OafA/YrhL